MIDQEPEEGGEPLSEQIHELGFKVHTLETSFLTLTREIDHLIGELETANDTITKLRAENLALRNQNTPPVTIPDTTATPDVEITFSLVGFPPQTLRPKGPGELWQDGKERRWSWDVTKEIRVVLDCKGEQRRIFLQRAWGDLPIEAGPLIADLVIKLSGTRVFSGPVRIHHHTRPPLTFNRLPLDTKALERVRALAPNYDPKAIPPAKDLEAMVTGARWDWKTWYQLNPAGSYDPWSEDFGFVTRSWVGGIPLMNEAAMFPIWDVLLLLTGDQRLYAKCADTADTSGNYAIHYWNRATGLPHTYSDSGSLPVLNADNLPALTSASGLKLPVGDIAHDFGLVNMMALLAGERYYVEELEAWTLLGPLARKPADRATGVYFSGQIRSNAWWMRNLFHLSLCYSGKRGEQIQAQLFNAIKYLLGLGKKYPATGLLDVSAFRSSPWTQFAGDGAKTGTVLTGNHHFLVHVLRQVQSRLLDDGTRYGALDGLLDHVLQVAEGVWKHSRHRSLIPWLQHVHSGTTWPDIMAATFGLFAPDRTLFATPVTSDIAAWWRAAVVVAVEIGKPWATEALAWIDQEFVKANRQPSINWQILPRTK